MRFRTEHVLEPRQVPWLGPSGFGLDAATEAHAFVAAQLGERRLGGEVPRHDPQADDAPEDGDRVVVASLAARGAEGWQPFAIRQRGQQVLMGRREGLSSRPSQAQSG